MPDAPHVLVVTEPDPGERAYEIVHDPSCPFEESDSGLGGDRPITFRYYTCGVGAQENHVGVADSLDGIEKLSPGRYPLRAVFEHTPSLPTNGGEEWDAWLEVDDA